MPRCFTICTCCALLCAATPVMAASLRGIVVDAAGKAVEFAALSVPSLQLGTISDEEGRFEIDLPNGPISITVMQIGYVRVVRDVHVAEDTAPLRIVLREEPVPVAEVEVTASGFGKTGSGEGAVVRRMDIVTTPGGAADIFQSLRALPGINAPNEGAALFVRGGDPSETLIRMDGGEAGHMYHFEGASGGLFSTLDAYMLKSAYFSSGGFSARYGGVLSGVLDIETRDPLNLRTVSMGANMVGGSLSTTWAVVPDKLSFVGSARWANPELLFRLYGSANEYQSTPHSQDGIGRLLYRYSPTGRLAATYLDSGNDIGMTVTHLNTSSQFTRDTRNRWFALNLQDVVARRVALRAQVSGQRYASAWTFGPDAFQQDERNIQANVEAFWPANDRHHVSFGGNFRRRDASIDGIGVADSTDYSEGAATRPIGIRARVDYPGVYVEDKVRLWGPLYATLGARTDYASRPGTWTLDPRAALAWRIDDHQTVRVATGRYHQLADPTYMDPTYGNPLLSPLRADHVIAGYEWTSDFGNVRLEAYQKDYTNLVTQDENDFYANGGYGYARGVDAFVQGTYQRLSGWVSYGYLDSRRKEFDDTSEVPSSYGVNHSATLVAKYQLHSTMQLGAKWNIATGRPYTPVIGATHDASSNTWSPVYAENNSGRMPAYHRLDIRVMRLFSLPSAGRVPQSNVCVLYIEAMNILNVRNVLDYVHNEDYTERQTTESYFGRRMLVAGFALSW